MKILHTADLHLKNTSHISTVQSIIKLATKELVDLIIIAGDLFDASADGRMLEAALLSVWQEFSGAVLIVPGNHDFRYLNYRDELAANVTVAHKTPYSVALIDGVYIVCVPYQASISLADIDIPHFEPSILITHGTYAANNDHTYFPISPADLKNRYRYVALGHYHSWFDKWIDGTLVVNPGAPRQTRKSDKGIRYVSLLDTGSWIMERIPLPVMFIDHKKIAVSVSDSEKEIQEKLLGATTILTEHYQATVSLELQGSLLFSTNSLSQKVEQWTKFLELNGRDIDRISWDLTKITQISPKIIHSAFARIVVDKISALAPKEVIDLAPFFFERIQQANQKFIDKNH